MNQLRTELGKITKASFGVVDDRPYLIGLQLFFESSSWGVGDGGKYMMNNSDTCRYKDGQREQAALRVIQQVHDLLAEAKVDSVAKLVGKPVEVTFDGNMFHSFRILTEVL